MEASGPPEPWREHYAHPCAWDQTFPPLAMTELFTASVAAHPNSPLVDFYGRTYTYAAMKRESAVSANADASDVTVSPTRVVV